MPLRMPRFADAMAVLRGECSFASARLEERDLSGTESDEPRLHALEGGRLLSEVTNRIVAMMHEHYGRGPIKAKSYVNDNLLVCVLSDGFTPIERTMAEAGEHHRIIELRQEFQVLMEARYSAMVEQLTGRKVLAFLSQVHLDPDLTVEIFALDGPPPGFDALQLAEPDRP
jgi:uncharacterized protein YbcI